jgi:hypothetical protein
MKQKCVLFFIALFILVTCLFASLTFTKKEAFREGADTMSGPAQGASDVTTGTASGTTTGTASGTTTGTASGTTSGTASGTASGKPNYLWTQPERNKDYPGFNLPLPAALQNKPISMKDCRTACLNNTSCVGIVTNVIGEGDTGKCFLKSQMINGITPRILNAFRRIK